MFLVFDMTDTSDMPAIAEPFFIQRGCVQRGCADSRRGSSVVLS